ncbi:MAG: MerR family transcriptional regulator [Actinomycetota bacterium]|nr:MerR family transcriptional regulator [Actinomycetota bacterium]
MSSAGGLAMGEVVARTGIEAGTIRMWEQRFGFPRPQRTRNGHRRYSADDVAALQRVIAYRRRGLSLPIALERARAGTQSTHRPSIYAAIATAEANLPTYVLRKRTLIGLSRAIEDEALARAAAPVVVAAFQMECFYRRVDHRYRRLAAVADAALVFADFPALHIPAGGAAEVPIPTGEPLEHEWVLIIDAPGYAACLLAWERAGPHAPGGPDDADRCFEAMWTTDPEVTRRACLVGANLASRVDPGLGGRVQSLLGDRPLALESPAPALTALTNRIIAYLEVD